MVLFERPAKFCHAGSIWNSSLTFSGVTVSHPKQLTLGMPPPPPLQDFAWRLHKFGYIDDCFFRPALSSFARSVIELHWPGTKQTLSIQHQPSVSALTAHNCLWDQALIERVIRHDFLVITFNDLNLNPSRRQRQLKALSMKDGAWCLTDLDLTWLGFLRVEPSDKTVLEVKRWLTLCSHTWGG